MSIEADNVIIGIIVGSLIASAFVLALILYIVRLWIRGPMKGSDNRRRLDGRIVAITGWYLLQGSELLSAAEGQRPRNYLSCSCSCCSTD